jgi:hypothetical protein
MLIPRVEHTRSWHKLLHDRTSNTIARPLADLPHINVTFVPYHLGSTGDPGIRLGPSKPSRQRRREPDVPVLPASIVVPKGTVPVSSARPRDRVTLAGRVKAVRVQPRAGVATLECTLTDGTGEIQVVFLGRRQVAGWEPGACVAVMGAVGERGGRKEILNPAYELLGGAPAP